MDVPLWIGLVAPGGPASPEPIESVEQFERLFGGEVLLGWNSLRNRDEFSWLPRTVRRFFAQGGQRCWVLGIPYVTGEALTPDRWVHEELTSATVADLPALAEAVLTRGERLRGLHAAFALTEPSLIALPDLYHGAIRPAPAAFRSPAIPGTTPVERPERAEFRSCGSDQLAAPRLRVDRFAVPAPGLRLHWTHRAAEAEAVEVQDAAEPEFHQPVILFRGGGHQATVWGSFPALRYFRARSLDGDRKGAWSDPVALVSPTPEERIFEVAPVDAARMTEIQAVQRALLRLCAARGDTVAVLGVPESVSAEEARTYAEALGDPRAPLVPIGRRGIAPLTGGELKVLSFGLLAHPWLVEREADGSLLSVPPDGAMVGLIVKRTLARGVWFAPGNEPLTAVIGLEPGLSRADQKTLIEAGINVLSTEPNGVVSLSANTLSADEAYRPLVVRRLLALLRRLALERGQRYAFEPLGDTLLRTVQHSFEELLGRLFARGAFAGRTPAAAYQVDAGPAVNPPSQMDLGRLVVELRVAPALPLTFITLRLEQAGGQGLITELG
jgi:hypothetical protein